MLYNKYSLSKRAAEEVRELLQEVYEYDPEVGEDLRDEDEYDENGYLIVNR